MKLEAITFAYGEKTICKDFSLELPDAGVTALAGPSGCGKTTLLRLLAGLEAPQAGRLERPGEAAVLFQENRLFPHLTAGAQIRAVLPKGGDSLPWLELVELGDQAHTPVEELSGGMQRRVALARCMAYGRDKSLFLMDEPFTGIDPARRRTLMEALRRTRTPVVFSAHDGESLVLADRVIRLEGPPLRVLD